MNRIEKARGYLRIRLRFAEVLHDAPLVYLESVWQGDAVLRFQGFLDFGEQVAFPFWDVFNVSVQGTFELVGHEHEFTRVFVQVNRCLIRNFQLTNYVLNIHIYSGGPGGFVHG